jgi:predicted alpha-1,2-mannosidase
MVQLSPDNGRGGWDWVSGYHWSDSIIVGFSHTHLSGTGIGDLLDVLVAPVPAEPDLAFVGSSYQEVPWGSRFSHDREEASPGYYAVDLLDSGVRAELTATPRVGVHRYTFPEGASPGIVLDLGYAQNWDTPVSVGLELHGDSLLTGQRFSTGWARDQRVFFTLLADRPIRRVTVRSEGEGTERWAPDRRRSWAASGTRLRAYVEFQPAPARPLELRVGLSYVDRAGSLDNLRTETPETGFAGYRGRAAMLWSEALDGVSVQGGTEAERSAFYTALYRARLAPVLFQDVDGRYRGADGEIRRAGDFVNHSIFSLWDTFRAAHPLYTLLDPDRVGHMMASMVAFGNEAGALPVWSLVANETNTMTGIHSLPVLADGILKGFGGGSADEDLPGTGRVDPAEALDLMVASAGQPYRGLDLLREYGYIPSELEVESVTKTLEYAFDYWTLAALAQEMGAEPVASEARALAGTYANVFHPQTGFMRGRAADGTWVEPFDPRRSSHRANTDYTEGNAWQHSWFVPHDPAGLIGLLGGDEAFISRLDQLFAEESVITGEDVSPDISGLIGQYAHGNEPSHHIAYLYSFAGAPWKTAETVRRILATQYAAAPDGLSGNEDCGQMSAWYVFSALGFYPANPTGGVYVLGSPLFSRAELDVGRGRAFVVEAPGASPETPYIQRAELNGRPLGRSWIRHDEIVAGGTLHLTMGPEPSASWGVEPESRPPSMSQEWWPAGVGKADPVHAPGTEREHARSEGQEMDSWPVLADSVRGEFLHAWNGYMAHARGSDALRPLSRTGRNWYDASLLMTPVDAFDTMLLMGLEDEAGAAKELVLSDLSFDHDFMVQVFEVTIRLLGGLLSAYEMDGDPRFLDLARDLGDRLLPAFESATGMPYVRVNLRTGEKEWPVNNPAEIGTLMLEFGTLSRHTGDPRYYDAAKAAIIEVFRRRSDIGLVGTTIDVESGEWQNTSSHISGMIDSYYEYLLKAWLLFGDEDFRRMWEASIPAVNRYLADPDGEGRLWYGHADMHDGERTATRFGALDAFMPAVLALGGDLDRARASMEAVYHMWTTFGIEPEQMDYSTMEPIYESYVLRPEAIESAYYLWTLTGDERYREMGAEMFRSIVRAARTETGYAHLRSVVTGEQDDAMESFFLAETLKYAFLLFSPPEVLDFHDIVFNTEAHPLRRGPEAR